MDHPRPPPPPRTGLAGLVGILTAIDKRATKGGSYTVDVSLNQYNRFLLAQGVLGRDVQRSLRRLHPDFLPRHYDDMAALLAKSLATLQRGAPRLFRPSYFASIASDFGGVGRDGGGGEEKRKEKMDVLTYLIPPVSYGVTRLGYDVGGCLPGSHEAEWPVDGAGEELPGKL